MKIGSMRILVNCCLPGPDTSPNESDSLIISTIVRELKQPLCITMQLCLKQITGQRYVTSSIGVPTWHRTLFAFMSSHKRVNLSERVRIQVCWENELRSFWRVCAWAKTLDSISSGKAYIVNIAQDDHWEKKLL